MKWLKESGCPWDICTFNNAAEYGNLETMKWLNYNGCPYNQIHLSIKNGNLETMKQMLIRFR